MKKNRSNICGTDELVCQNGSVCKQGIPIPSNINPSHTHLGLLTHLESKVDANSYHCECRSGYIGHDCSVQVSDCISQRSDLVHHCYYGSRCVALDADNEDGLLDRFCDCTKANVEDGMFVSGLMCQYKSTSLCVGEDFVHEVTNQYCVNGGECSTIVSPARSHPGCICDDDKWEGAHCEFAKGVLFDDALDLFQQRKTEFNQERGYEEFASSSPQPLANTIHINDTNPDSRLLFVIGACFAVGGVVILLMFGIKQSRNKKRQITDDVAFVREHLGIDGDSVASSSSYWIVSPRDPPTNVFLASRKKDVGSDEDSTEHVQDKEKCCSTPRQMEEADTVEMLDEETSRMLEAQFNSSPWKNDEESKISEYSTSTKRSVMTNHSRLYYENIETFDEETEKHHSGRVTVNRGRYPLSHVQRGAEPSIPGILDLVNGDGLTVYEDDGSRIQSLDGDEFDSRGNFSQFA